ncbi:hypothetical protein KGQ71_03390 [Patescibacteria group bacterium]|nr:hypothetical protein [Patescibacteria group bacterium]
MKLLTDSQQRLFDYIQGRYSLSGGISPSYSEMREYMGVASNEAITGWIDALVQKGFLERIPGKARGLKPISQEVVESDWQMLPTTYSGMVVTNSLPKYVTITPVFGVSTSNTSYLNSLDLKGGNTSGTF